MEEASAEGVAVLRSLALAVRSEQDFGALPPAAATVGALKPTGARADDAATAKRLHGYRGLLAQQGFAPLRLREALNKIAHADPAMADFYVGPRDAAHDLLLFGVRGRQRWFAAVSVLELVKVIRSLPDHPMRRGDPIDDPRDWDAQGE